MPLTAFAQDVLKVDFQGVDPALQSPWTSTSFLAPNLSFGGVDFGVGAFASPGFTDAFAFHLAGGSNETTFADAIRDGEHLSFTLTDLLIQANGDARMGERYMEYLDMLQREGVTLFMHFSYVGSWGKYGSWGSLEYQDQHTESAPKFQALLDWMVPVLSVEGLVAGQDASLKISRATPGGTVLWGYSLTGAGPTPTSSGDFMLSAPVHTLANGTADEGGSAVAIQNLSAATSGISVWFHAFDVSSQTFSNGLGVVIP